MYLRQYVLLQSHLQEVKESRIDEYDLDKEIATAYGLNAFPYWVFLDKDLNVVARRTGNLPQDQVGQLLTALALQSR